MKKELKYDIDADGVVSEWTDTVIETANTRTISRERTVKCEPGDDVSGVKEEIKLLAKGWTPETIKAYKAKLEAKASKPVPVGSSVISDGGI
tara:strand:- start:154 stop:429 length:276 start_codon:yes stop_codon:yes gene_type:complete